jgi:hypothetical protein
LFTESDIKESVVKASDNKQKYMLLTFTKDEAANSLTGAILPQFYFDQIQVVCGHVSNAVNAMKNKAVTGTKFTRHNLKKS